MTTQLNKIMQANKAKQDAAASEVVQQAVRVQAERDEVVSLRGNVGLYIALTGLAAGGLISTIQCGSMIEDALGGWVIGLILLLILLLAAPLAKMLDTIKRMHELEQPVLGTVVLAIVGIVVIAAGVECLRTALTYQALY